MVTARAGATILLARGGEALRREVRLGSVARASARAWRLLVPGRPGTGALRRQGQGPAATACRLPQCLATQGPPEDAHAGAPGGIAGGSTAGERDAGAAARESAHPYPAAAHNVDGAYSFLYPALGVGRHDGRVLLAFTSTPEEWSGLDVRWYGCFRSRARARAAFDALVALFGRLGHLEPASRLPDVRLRRGARLEAFRRVPAGASRCRGRVPLGRLHGPPGSALRSPARELAARDARQPTSRRSCGPWTPSPGGTSPPCAAHFGRWDAPAACPGTSATRSSSLRAAGPGSSGRPSVVR